MRKVIVIGSLNIDYIFKVKNLPLVGETVISKNYSLSEGGKGANQAVSMSRLGINVNMVGKIGKDIYGEMIIKSLINSNVNVDGIITDSKEKTGIAFITIDKNGDNTIVIAPGANGKIKNRDIESKEKIILDSDLIVIQLEIPMEVINHVIKFSKKNGKVIILNFSPALDIDKDIVKLVDYLILNESELRYLTAFGGTKIGIQESIKELKGFFNNNIIITLGKKGSLFTNARKEIIQCPAYDVESIDTTGAGDAFIGGFVSGLMSNKSIEECIDIGNAAGALSTIKLGAQPSFPYKNDLVNFLRSKKKKNIKNI